MCISIEFDIEHKFGDVRVPPGSYPLTVKHDDRGEVTHVFGELPGMTDAGEDAIYHLDLGSQGAAQLMLAGSPGIRLITPPEYDIRWQLFQDRAVARLFIHALE